MAYRMSLTVAALATVLLCSLASPVSAADFTAGMVIDTYKYYFNVTSYANISIDLSAMIDAVNANDYALAQDIYVTGRYAFRNLATGTYRNAQPVIQRNYTSSLGYAEPWWMMAQTYYNLTLNATSGMVNSSLYLDKPISDALSGTGDFHPSGQFAAYRPQMLKAYLKFYPTLYFSHELDAGYTALQGDPTRVRNAHSETDHGMGAYAGVSPSSTDRITVRVAPLVTAWDVSNEVGKFFCTTKELVKGAVRPYTKETISEVNFNFLTIAKRIQALFVDPVPARVEPSALLLLRFEQMKNVNINQIQLVLQAIYNAAQELPCDKPNRECKVPVFAAEAYAHFRMAQIVLNYYGSPWITKGSLQAVEALLHPRVWKAAAVTKDSLANLYKQTLLAIKAATDKSGYDWNKQFAQCKLPKASQMTAAVMGVSAASVAADVNDVVADANDVVAASVEGVTATSAAAAAEPTPVAAAVAAIQAAPIGADGSGAGITSEDEADGVSSP